MSATRIKLAEAERMREKLQKDIDARQRAIEQEQAAKQAARDAANAEARNRYLAELKQREDALKAASDARVAAERAPEKARQMHVWLAQHPGKTAGDFEKAWPHLEETLFGHDAMLQREIQAQRERMGRL